jgi:uncharacterized protein YidB (DUF937 family)
MRKGRDGAAVLPAVLNEVLGSNNQGGLGAIVARLQQAGFGEQVKSWLGNGQNLPISSDQLRQVLGNDTVRQLAARYNIPVDQLSQILAQELPKAVEAPRRLRRAAVTVPDGIAGGPIRPPSL